jgi:hypothetical protein
MRALADRIAQRKKNPRRARPSDGAHFLQALRLNRPSGRYVSPLKRSRLDGATGPSTQVRFHRPKVVEGITITCPSPNSGTRTPWPGFNSDPMTEARHVSASRTLRRSDVPSGPFHWRELALAIKNWNSAPMIQYPLFCISNKAPIPSYHSPSPQQLECEAEAAHQHTHQQQPNRLPSNDSSINPGSRRVQTPDRQIDQKLRTTPDIPATPKTHNSTQTTTIDTPRPNIGNTPEAASQKKRDTNPTRPTSTHPNYPLIEPNSTPHPCSQADAAAEKTFRINNKAPMPAKEATDKVQSDKPAPKLEDESSSLHHLHRFNPSSRNARQKHRQRAGQLRSLQALPPWRP